MKYEAIESFSGVISMAEGEVREIPNEELAKDLIKSGFIKKYTPNDSKSLKKELDEANKRIAILEQEKTELEEEISKLKETSDEVDSTPEEDASEENEPSEEDGNPEDENGETSDEVDSTPEDETPESEE